MPKLKSATGCLAFILALVGFAGCQSSPDAKTAASSTAAPPPQAPAAATPPAPSPTADASVTIECRAKTAADTIELAVDWGTGGGVGKGTLKTGKTTSRPVRATQYKGIILIDAPDEKNPAIHLGQVQEVDGKKTIQIGDYKSPLLPCE